MITYKTSPVNSETFEFYPEIDTGIPVELIESVRNLTDLHSDSWLVSPIVVDRDKCSVNFAAIYRRDPSHSDSYKISIQKFNR